MENNLIYITKFYDIYINKYGIDTPANFYGVVKVIGEKDDSLIDDWCLKTFGNKYRLNKNNLFESWKYSLTNNYDSDRIFTIIQRKI